MKIGKFFLVFLLCTTFPVSIACAYFDPNVGGSLFQMLMPILAVLLGFIAFAWNFIKKNIIALFMALRKGVFFLISGFKKKENE